MAVAPTGTIYKALEFDGVSSRTYGVYITGAAVYNAPERDVEMIAIPGRNGSFALDKGRFENIEVTYPAGIFADNEADFAQAISDFRNFLCSRNGYVRLQDEYNPNEYRMAVYKSGLEVEPALLRAGEFEITFECKPQRYLTSGEEPITLGYTPLTDEDDTAPYFIRRSPQLDVDYDAENDTLVGASVGWNQIARDNVTGTLDRDTARTRNISTGNIASITNHVYLATVNIKNDTTANGMIFQYSASKWFGQGVGWKACLYKAGDAASTYIYTYIGMNEASGTTIEYENFNMFDLTLMFGTTIADYIYTLEQGTAGAGVSFFRKYFPADYYPYSSGEIRSVEGLVSHDMVGFNQWDEEWELGGINASTGQNTSGSTSIRCKNYIQVMPSTPYYVAGLTSGNCRPVYYDANKNFISAGYWQGGTSNNPQTTPSNARFMRFYLASAYGTTYGHDICINISNADLNGQYKAYEKHSYPLDSTVTLRGLLKLEDGKLKADGDVYKASGEVVRNWGERAYQEGDVSDFTTMITDGTRTVYKLDAPTTDTATPFAEVQTVYKDGTEQYVSTGLVPIGHKTRYGKVINDVVNPTLFESKPLLELTGYGDINVNDYTINVVDDLVGDVKIAGVVQSYGKTNYYVNFPEIYINNGDDIDVGSVQDVGLSAAITDANGYNITSASIQNASGYSQILPSIVDDGSPTAILTVPLTPTMTFHYGTPLTNKETLDLTLTNSNSDTQTYHIEFGVGYNGNKTIRFYNVGLPNDGYFKCEATDPYMDFNGIVIHSTATTFGSPTYIDCEFGEAYTVINGVYNSLNAYVALGSELPSLAPGSNSITFDNTFTNVKVMPRWWKV